MNERIDNNNSRLQQQELLNAIQSCSRSDHKGARKRSQGSPSSGRTIRLAGREMQLKSPLVNNNKRAAKTKELAREQAL